VTKTERKKKRKKERKKVRKNQRKEERKKGRKKERKEERKKVRKKGRRKERMRETVAIKAYVFALSWSRLSCVGRGGINPLLPLTTYLYLALILFISPPFLSNRLSFSN
jgi:hypothetical protein